MDNDRTQRARRARYEDIVRLKDEIASLKSEIAALRAAMPGRGLLPMTREEFTGHAIIATIQSGGWGQLKYAGQRAGEAYEQWQRLCTPPSDEVPVLSEPVLASD